MLSKTMVIRAPGRFKHVAPRVLMRCAEIAVGRWTAGRKPAFTVNINLNKWFTLRFCLRGGDT